ncbi:hypothetical protein C0993_012242 [Termitomyces sp. T159_Od127]|nr:hypothetical protein C0993_012242 [Termitomyces sp. T159_Od127]
MIPTPDLSHLAAKDYEHVYEPAEDTFLLLDALEEDEKALKNLRPIISLEIGSGSGCVSAFIGKILGPSVRALLDLQPACPLRINTFPVYLCSDINPYACTCTRATGTQNKVVLDAINASFASPLMARLQRAVDIILFNPPYVPTIPEEMNDAQDTRGISGSWAGGTNGMNVTDIFLEHVEVYSIYPGLLKPVC